MEYERNKEEERSGRKKGIRGAPERSERDEGKSKWEENRGIIRGCLRAVSVPIFLSDYPFA